MSRLWGRRHAGSWPRRWCCLWDSPRFLQSAGGERENSQHHPRKPGFVTGFTGQRLVSISKHPVSKALFAVWLQPYPFLVMPFSKESLFFFVFPSLNPHLACYLFSPGKWVLLDGPAAESDTALADGSLEQALVLWAQRLWCKTETRGFQGQTCEEPITGQTCPVKSQPVHQVRGSCQLRCYLMVSVVKVQR